MSKKSKSKWWSTMIATHGSEEAVREHMRQANAKSSKNAKGTGGFAYVKEHTPEKLTEWSAKGGKLSKRGSAR